MSEWKSFIAIAKGVRSDMIVLLTTFLLTVLVDLTVAIEIGMVLAVFLFMRKMIQFSEVNILTRSLEDDDGDDPEAVSNYTIPAGVEVFEIKGPLFFGAAYKFKEAARFIEKPPKVLIIRMRQVPIIDATGIQALKEVYKASKYQGTAIVLSGVKSGQVMQELTNSGLIAAIGPEQVAPNLSEALQRVNTILAKMH